MNKQELITELKKEVERQETRLKVLKDLKTLDLSKHDQKVLSKRITNDINKHLKESRCYFKQETFVSDQLVLSFKTKKNNYETLEICLENSKTRVFELDGLKQNLTNYINTIEKELEQLKHDIKHIVTKINLYNKIVELEEKLSNETSYQFRNTACYTRNTYHKIANPNKKERILSYLHTNELSEGTKFIFERKNYIAHRTIKKQYKDFIIYNYSYSEDL